jgi:acetoin utilization deacetylase AcuC-like enzyme
MMRPSMITIFSEAQRRRSAVSELHGGLLVPPHESVARVDFVLAQIHAVGLGEVVPPDEVGLEPILRVHDAAFVDFLEHAWQDWVAAGYQGEAIPSCWPARGLRCRAPAHIDGRLGYYAFAAETSINEGTWTAARASAAVAVSAARRLAAGSGAAFGLCRPPGHHAARDLYGGYCFLNNAAIAAQSLRDAGAERVAILDVDFHHGNGTQDIFYQRADVLYLSIHGDPRQAFPYFLGYADETGAGSGIGCNANFPLPPGSDYRLWSEALRTALERIRGYAPQALVVSLGVDTYELDPISFFRLGSDDFSRYGAMIGALHLPTVFLLEGGYAVEAIGINAVNVLTGFEGVGGA